jgi:hypothetical protein
LICNRGRSRSVCVSRRWCIRCCGVSTSHTDALFCNRGRSRSGCVSWGWSTGSCRVSTSHTDAFICNWSRSRRCRTSKASVRTGNWSGHFWSWSYG